MMENLQAYRRSIAYSLTRNTNMQRKAPAFIQTSTVHVAQKALPRVSSDHNLYRGVAITIGPVENARCHSETFHNAIGSVIITAQCFGLLPIQGVKQKEDQLRFRWLSVPMLYTSLSLLGALITTIFCIIDLTNVGLTFATSSCTVFSLNSVATQLLFLKLATQWPGLIFEWHRVEVVFQARYQPVRITKHLNCIAAALLLLALVEHLLANLQNMELALECACCDASSVFHAFMLRSNGYVFHRSGYALWKGILLSVMSIIKTFCWNFTDLFITLVSTALAERYSAFNHRINSVYGKVMPPLFWQVTREDYNLLANLTRHVDTCLNKIMLLSFASNLYFICYQMLNSMRPLGDFNEALYFYWSILYIILKTCAVSLSTASIHDQSLKPKPCLYAVPTMSYGPEVERFLLQITTDDIALTGMNFFAVTRAFVMTVAGTIVTYEVVLLQFNLSADLSSNQVPRTNNGTLRCHWFTDTTNF